MTRTTLVARLAGAVIVGASASRRYPHRLCIAGMVLDLDGPTWRDLLAAILADVTPAPLLGCAPWGGTPLDEPSGASTWPWEATADPPDGVS